MDLKYTSRRQVWVVVAIIIVFAWILLVTLDQEEILRVLSQADWRPALAAIFFTLVSYTCAGFSFALVSRSVGIHMRRRDLTEIGILSIILNHVVSAAGVAGVSMRYLLMKSHGVKLQDVIATTILHAYLTSLDMLTMLPLGFVYLLLNTTVPRGLVITISLTIMILVIVAILAALLIFVDTLRTKVLTFIGRVIHKVARQDWTTRIENFDQTFSHGAQLIRLQRGRLASVMILTYADWLASVLVLYFCFDALGPRMPLPMVASGFVIGIMAGVLSMVPGGIGVQEGSMAGVFKLMGASFEQAVLASLLFRVIYYLLSYFISILFYSRLLHQERKEVEAP